MIKARRRNDGNGAVYNNANVYRAIFVSSVGYEMYNFNVHRFILITFLNKITYDCIICSIYSATLCPL
jgi:hypothetical protein